MSRYDSMANRMPSMRDPKFRAAVEMKQTCDEFLAVCKRADERGKKLTPQQQAMRERFEKMTRGKP